MNIVKYITVLSKKYITEAYESKCEKNNNTSKAFYYKTKKKNSSKAITYKTNLKAYIEVP